MAYVKKDSYVGKGPGNFKKPDAPPVHKGFLLTESQIRYAMANTYSNAEAARWLHIAYPTWKKYAEIYIDAESGLTLLDLHKLTKRLKVKKLPKDQQPKRKTNWPNRFVAKPMSEIFDNKYPNYMLSRFRQRLVEEGHKEECCDACGFRDYRPFDYAIPLRMHWVDGNPHNYNLLNIQFLCFNCYFVNIGNFGKGTAKKYYLDAETGEPVPVRSTGKNAHHRDLMKVGFKEYMNPGDSRTFI